ncbi:hypothetical protein KP509_07G075200 [Ceratopteris richardii]|uniref:Uncharacterized protein n=1 Tax=Ceratopteris richardii TaxID=49495 RepID=A0A8T2UIB2_CERRI|nr:hypothetical protein KP509_07G075200 [Ceratopteris richardii]
MARPPQLGQWTTGFCDCCSHCDSCCCTYWCPCIAVGRIVNVADLGQSCECYHLHKLLSSYIFPIVYRNMIHNGKTENCLEAEVQECYNLMRQLSDVHLFQFERYVEIYGYIGFYKC